MSVGKGKHHRRARPAQTNREACARWGLQRSPAESFRRGIIGRATSDEAAVYIADESRRGHPVNWPLRNCGGSAIEAITIDVLIKKHRAHRIETRTYICDHCHAWMVWRHSRELQAELGFVSQRIGDEQKEMNRRQQEELWTIELLAGGVDDPDQYLDYYETHIISYHVRRCLGAWQAATL